MELEHHRNNLINLKNMLYSISCHATGEAQKEVYAAYQFAKAALEMVETHVQEIQDQVKVDNDEVTVN